MPQTRITRHASEPNGRSRKAMETESRKGAYNLPMIREPDGRIRKAMFLARRLQLDGRSSLRARLDYPASRFRLLRPSGKMAGSGRGITGFAIEIFSNISRCRGRLSLINTRVDRARAASLSGKDRLLAAWLDQKHQAALSLMPRLRAAVGMPLFCASSWIGGVKECQS